MAELLEILTKTPTRSVVMEVERIGRKKADCALIITRHAELQFVSSITTSIPTQNPSNMPVGLWREYARCFGICLEQSDGFNGRRTDVTHQALYNNCQTPHTPL